MISDEVRRYSAVGERAVTRTENRRQPSWTNEINKGLKSQAAASRYNEASQQLKSSAAKLSASIPLPRRDVDDRCYLLIWRYGMACEVATLVFMGNRAGREAERDKGDRTR